MSLLFSDHWTPFLLSSRWISCLRAGGRYLSCYLTTLLLVFLGPGWNWVSSSSWNGGRECNSLQHCASPSHCPWATHVLFSAVTQCTRGYISSEWMFLFQLGTKPQMSWPWCSYHYLTLETFSSPPKASPLPGCMQIWCFLGPLGLHREQCQPSRSNDLCGRRQGKAFQW